MVMLTPEKDPWYAPCPKDRAYAETVLELTYYQRDLHLSYIDDETRDSLAKDDAARRSKGQRLLQILPGNWRSKFTTFWARGEFAGISREEAVVIILQAYLDVCPHIISVPALNKWLSLLASFADIARGDAIHQLTSQAILYKTGYKPRENDDDPSDEDAREAGLQKDGGDFERVNQTRQKKVIT